MAIAMATGKAEDWDEVYPGYVRSRMTHGSLVVADRAGAVTGFGATVQIGTSPPAICMLTDLFVAPAAHGTGTGRAILGALWTGEQRRMTFSSLHANALPLYTSFGVDAWWPLLYLGGDVGSLRMPPGWSVAPAEPKQPAALERDRTPTHPTPQHPLSTLFPRHEPVS